jgi:hypothetical protein
VSNIYPTDFNRDPDYNTPFADNGTQVSLNAGFISDRLGIGLTVNGLQEQIGTASAYGISASLGAVYSLTRTITLGAAGLHLGSSTGFTDDAKNLGQGYALPRSARAGIAFTDTLYGVPFTASGDAVYRDVGLRGTPLSQRFNRLTVPLGIEIRPTSYVAVRLGKRLNYDTELMTFGAGLHWSMLTFDLAVVLANFVSDVQVQPFFSLSYSLGTPTREMPKVKAPAPVIFEKPAEVKSTPPATPVQSAPAPDTAVTPSTVPVQHPAAAPSDSIIPVPDQPDKNATQKSAEQSGKSAQADSIQTIQPVAPGKP